MRTRGSAVLLLPVLVAVVSLGGTGACAGFGPEAPAPPSPRAAGPDSSEPASAGSSLAPRRTCHVAKPPPLFARRLRIDAATCVDVDGALGEWPALLETTGTTETGRAFAVELATDDTQLYLAARLHESRDAPAQGDVERLHVRLWFLDEAAHGPPLDVWLAIPPGRQGSGAVTLAEGDGAPEPVAGARMQVQGSPRELALEGAIPWSALPPSQRSPLGLRASVAYERERPSGQRAVVGIGTPDGGLLPSPLEQSLLSDLDEEARRLWPRATRRWLDAGADFPYAADILSDARLERIGRVGGRVTVCRTAGAGVAGRCQALDYGRDARIAGIEAREVLGRGKKDLVVLYWTPTSTAQHLVLDLLAPDDGQWLRSVFKHEVSVSMHCCGSEGNAPPHVRGEVTLEQGAVEIRAEQAWRASERTFNEPPLGNGVLPPVMPWDSPPRRRYVVKEGRLVHE
jgi:hypothetical protein